MKRTKGIGPFLVISDEMAATSSGCPNDTAYSFFSVKKDQTNPRKWANPSSTPERGKIRQINFPASASQGEEYWKLKQISLFKGV
jgi:hypothetical protein